MNEIIYQYFMKRNSGNLFQIDTTDYLSRSRKSGEGYCNRMNKKTDHHYFIQVQDKGTLAESFFVDVRVSK